eukprot:5430677-Prymnesium_polylepis.1
MACRGVGSVSRAAVQTSRASSEAPRKHHRAARAAAKKTPLIGVHLTSGELAEAAAKRAGAGEGAAP